MKNSPEENSVKSRSSYTPEGLRRLGEIVDRAITSRGMSARSFAELVNAYWQDEYVGKDAISNLRNAGRSDRAKATVNPDRYLIYQIAPFTGLSEKELLAVARGEQVERAEVGSLSKLIQMELAQRQISVEEFARIVRLSKRVVEMIIEQNKLPGHPLPKLMALAPHLSDPRSGQPFREADALAQYLGLIKQTNNQDGDRHLTQ